MGLVETLTSFRGERILKFYIFIHIELITKFKVKISFSNLITLLIIKRTEKKMLFNQLIRET